MLPSSSDLAYFIQAANSGNFSRASERLGISQPTLSIAIQRLERELGSQLFLRSKSGVSLTRAGKQLFAHSKELIESWEKIRSRALASMHEPQGQFAIGCHSSVAIYSLPRFLPQALAKYPHLEFKLVHDLSRKILESVVQMETDIGIVVNPVRHSDLVIKKLCTDEVCFWTSSNSSAQQNLFSGEAVLICDEDLIQTQTLLSKLKKGGVKFGRTISTSSLELGCTLVSGGAGIGILPSRVVEAQAKGRLKKIASTPVFEDEICMVYRHELKNIHSIQILTDLIQKGFSKGL
jgi:LysR family transcriptional regulator, cell division regulator